MYSQNNEEEIILKLLGDITGVFLDVGAYDGKAFSNTLALIERGWRGILVEPSPGPFAKLTDRHNGNINLALINSAVGKNVGSVSFWPSEDGVSTTVETHFKKWNSVVVFGEPIQVPQITFHDIAALYPVWFLDIKFLNIDTEGTSADLLLLFPFGLARPQVVCVEHDNRSLELKSHMRDYGYRCELENGENLIFVWSQE